MRQLLTEIDSFLADAEMGPTYFGKLAAGNSNLVGRLRAGRPIQSDTIERVEEFIRVERERRNLPVRTPAPNGQAQASP
jgi:hypothetical protein